MIIKKKHQRPKRKKFRCLKCGHEWAPRATNAPADWEPQACSRCKSYTWKRPRAAHQQHAVA